MGSQKSEPKDISFELVCPPELHSVLCQIQNPRPSLLAPNKPQQALIESVEEDWLINAWWIAYERFPNANIRRYPFNTPKFQVRRSKAKLLCSQMDLQKGVFEDQRTSKLYENPLQYWCAAMEELKQAQLNSVYRILPGKFTSTFATPSNKEKKPGHIDLLKAELKSMRDQGKVPEGFRSFPIHHDLFETALDLANRNAGARQCQEFKRKYWKPFLDAFWNYIQDIEKRPELGRINAVNDELLEYVRGKPKRKKYRLADEKSA